MNRNHFEEVRLRDFRCFHAQQRARLAPLTLLVGDNSTGKTSFLAAVRAVWEVAFLQSDPDFREPPYDLGAFPEIVHSRSDGESRAASFEIGFRGRDRRRRPVEFDVAFRSRAAAPSPARLSWRTKDVRVACSPVSNRTAKPRSEQSVSWRVDLASGNGEWRLEVDVERGFRRSWTPLRFLLRWIRESLGELEGSSDRLQKLNGTVRTPGPDDLRSFSDLLRSFVAFPAREPPFASAPIRSSPSRTYNPSRPSPDPEGAYIPTYFASVHFQDRGRWLQLKEKLEHFGRRSGLFDEVAVKQLGEMEGGPFQLQIRQVGKRGPGPGRNLIDVGYGVSQALPVLAEVFRPDAPPMLLFQQPEVHLHPSAQAALGSLFCETAVSGRQLVIETHSDYIVDRILLDVRDKRTDLGPKDVSILYFQREDLDVRIHSIRVDDEGSVLDAPEGYRRFFTDELNRVISY